MNMLKETAGKIILKTLGLKKALKMYYKIKMGWNLNLVNPKRYTEKIQVRKLNNYNNQKYILCADKYKVREYIKNKIGEEYLVPIYFAKDQIKLKDLEKLPNKFVLKTNNASATNIIVTDKSQEDLHKLVKKMNKYVKYQFGYRTFELFYNQMPPKIIAEKYIGTQENYVPNDYKFQCFKQNDGSFIIIIQADHGRYSQNHSRIFFNENWEIEPYGNTNTNLNYEFPKPKKFAEMLTIVKKLASDFDYVRVDLYEIEGKIYFGELTFTDGSGYDKLVPDRYDFIWGEYWKMVK